MRARPFRTIHAFHEFGEAIREPFEADFPERELVVWTEDDEFAGGIEDVEVLFAVRAPRDHWARAKRLRLIQLSGAGVDSLLPAPALPARVQIANARGVHEPWMSEFALAQVLALAKRLPRAMRQQQRREWRFYLPRPLSGRTLGVLGLGEIGQGVARRAAALGMRVIGTRRSGAAIEGVDEVFAASQTERVLRESDVVVVVLPLTEETRGLLDAEAIASMKRHALLVNIARGGIVDEEAVCRALHERHLAGAAFDVFDREPLPESSPLWDAPNVLITPHVAGAFPDYMARVAEILVENIRRLERGEPLRNAVDRDRGY